MGLLKAMHRRTWKNAVGNEFFNQHGVSFRTLADIVGPATLDDLLNDEYECNSRSPWGGAANLARVLHQSFGINISLLAMRSQIDALGWGRYAAGNEPEAPRDFGR